MKIHFHELYLWFFSMFGTNLQDKDNTRTESNQIKSSQYNWQWQLKIKL